MQMPTIPNIFPAVPMALLDSLPREIAKGPKTNGQQKNDNIPNTKASTPALSSSVVR